LAVRRDVASHRANLLAVLGRLSLAFGLHSLSSGTWRSCRAWSGVYPDAFCMQESGAAAVIANNWHDHYAPVLDLVVHNRRDHCKFANPVIR
jgi:hypothetical protein